MNNREEVLIISNHFRPIPFFDTTLKNLVSSGYSQFLIQNTGGEDWTKFSYSGCDTFGNTHKNFYHAMMSFKRQIDFSLYPEVKYILLLDNDCFLSSRCLDKFIQEAVVGKYDFVSHLCSAKQYEGVEFGNGEVIQEVLNQHILYGDDIPPEKRRPMCPHIAPVPHWENALEFMTKDLYTSLNEDDFRHGCYFLSAINDRIGAKIGAHKVKFGKHKIQYGDDGWIHVGAVMPIYMALERADYMKMANHHGDFMASRLGMLIQCQRIYKDFKLPPSVLNSISDCCDFFGGEDYCINLWEEITRSTIMSDSNLWKE